MPYIFRHKTETATIKKSSKLKEKNASLLTSDERNGGKNDMRHGNGILVISHVHTRIIYKFHNEKRNKIKILRY